MMPVLTWVVSALLADDLLALNRATGILRRRNLPVGAVSVGPGGRPGSLRLTCIVSSDRAAADRLASALRKMTEVREVSVYAEGEGTCREHALVRVRVSPAQLSAILDVISLYEATILNETPQELLLEASGSAPLMVSFIRALEPFGIFDVARSVTPLPPQQAPLDTAGAPRASIAAPRIGTAVPA
jgi:acetolactate synthase-1/3 small subunit